MHLRDQQRVAVANYYLTARRFIYIGERTEKRDLFSASVICTITKQQPTSLFNQPSYESRKLDRNKIKLTVLHGDLFVAVSNMAEYIL